MDWNRIEGNWKQFKGRAKEKWGRLTDDELDVINGRQDQLEGKIQERYGLSKDQKGCRRLVQVTAVAAQVGAQQVEKATRSAVAGAALNA
jgi:uncharacterized protein YjbJ (UPF0337 family)